MTDFNPEVSSTSLEINDTYSEYQDVGVDLNTEFNLQVEEASERLSNISEI